MAVDLSCAPPSWVEAEMETLSLPDNRLEDRVRKLIADMSRNPNGSIPEICQSRAATQAAYNFFDHPTLNAEAILQAQHHCAHGSGRLDSTCSTG